MDANGEGWIQFRVLINYQNWSATSFDFDITKVDFTSNYKHCVFSLHMDLKGLNLYVTPNEKNDARWSWKKTADVPGKHIEYEITFSNILPDDRGYHIFSMGQPNFTYFGIVLDITQKGLLLSIVIGEYQLGWRT